MIKKFFILLILICSIIFSSCGSYTSKSSYVDSYTSAEESIDAELAYGADSKNTLSSNDFISAENSNQKLIYNGSLEIISEEIEDTFNETKDILSKYDAKFESLDKYYDTYNLTIRVENSKFSDLFNALQSTSGVVQSSNIYVDDATKHYSDNERKIKSLEAEYDTLLKLLDKAETVEEIIQIQDRLSYIKYDIDSYKESNSNIDYDVKYSKINLTIRSSKVENESKESFGKEIKDGFKLGLYGLRSFILVLVRAWWAVIIISIIVALCIKASKKNTIKKQQINYKYNHDVKSNLIENVDIVEENNLEEENKEE